MGLKGVAARLASLLVHLYESEGIRTRETYKIPTRYTHQPLGAMIGAKRVAVNRALNEFAKAGVVELKRRYTYIKDVRALKRAASG